MITIGQFEFMLWNLELLDMQELVDTGAIEDRDYATWDEFQADRMTWFLMHPAKAPAVRRAVWQHKPKTQQPQMQDNVIELVQRRAGKD